MKKVQSCGKLRELYDQWYDWWWKFDTEHLSDAEGNDLDKLEKEFETLTDELENKLCKEALPSDKKTASPDYLSAKKIFDDYSEKAKKAKLCDDLENIYNQWYDWWDKFDTDRMSDAEEKDLDRLERKFETLVDQLEKNLRNEGDEGKNGSPSTSNNWDKVLDTYEDYVDKYIAYLKKAASGDISATTQCASLLAKVEALEDQLENATESMTAKQIDRYAKINAKMLESALDGFQ